MKLTIKKNTLLIPAIIFLLSFFLNYFTVHANTATGLIINSTQITAWPDVPFVQARLGGQFTGTSTNIGALKTFSTTGDAGTLPQTISPTGWNSAQAGYYGLHFYTLPCGIDDPEEPCTTFYYQDVYFDGSTWQLASSTEDTTSPYNALQTRFLDVEITGNATNTVFEIDFYLETSEINTSIAQRNPTYVSVQITDDQQTITAEQIDNTMQGTQTVTVNHYDLADGGYTAYVRFSNISCQTNQDACPFNDSYAYIDFLIEDGEITEITELELYDRTNPPEAPINCSFTDIGGCLVTLARYLFVPSQASVGQALGLVSSSSIPFVQEGYNYYQTTSQALEESQTGFYSGTTTMGVLIDTPALEPFQLFSIGLITQNLGSAAPILRSIALAVMIITFAQMIIATIQDKMSVSIRSTDYKVK